MSTLEQTPDQVIQSLYQFAAAQMRAGQKRPQIEQALIEKGLDAEAAKALVGNLFKMRSRVARQTGLNNMLGGAASFVLGVAITAGTYAMAEGSGGGMYFISVGPIVFGAFRFIRGLGQAAIG